MDLSKEKEISIIEWIEGTKETPTICILCKSNKKRDETLQDATFNKSFELKMCFLCEFQRIRYI